MKKISTIFLSLFLFGIIGIFVGKYVLDTSVELKASHSYYKCSSSTELSCLNKSNKCSDAEIKARNCIEIIGESYEEKQPQQSIGLSLVIISFILLCISFLGMFVASAIFLSRKRSTKKRKR